MEDQLKFTANNLNDTEQLAKIFASVIKDKSFLICLYGDIGTGKTAFVRFLAKHLGVREKVTSPSFVILNEYITDAVNLKHFDLYRLEREGIDTIIEELEEYTEDDNIITLIEWAEFSSGNLPAERIEINIKYIEEEKREFYIKAFGDRPIEIVKSIKKEASV